MIPTLLLISLMVFFLIRAIPGDAVDALVAKMASMGTTVEISRQQVTERLGLDVPFFTQYGRWLGVLPQADGNLSGVLQGDLGGSFWKPSTVAEEISNKWPVTFELSVLALIVALVISLPIGIYSALRQNTWGDYLGRTFALLCMAVPSFWLGALTIVLPAMWWGWSPPIRYVSFSDDPLGNLQMFLLPAIVLGMSLAGITMRFTRTMMLEVLRQDYIRTAWAKGLRERVVISRHALKNALIPLVTLVGLQMPFLLGGTVVVEKIFALPGIGRLMFSATLERDYPILCGVMLIFALILMLTNLIVDLTYGFLDARVRYS